MKRLLFFLAVLFVCMAGARAQGPTDWNLGSQLAESSSTGAYSFSWWGTAGNTYLMETSDDLINWSYIPVVESGTGGGISWGLVTSATSLFMKLEYITVPAAQLSGTALNGPLDPSGNGLPQDWELFFLGSLGVDPNMDANGEGLTVLQDYENGINPVANEVVSTGSCVGEYLFHETSGTVAHDLSILQNNGLLSSGASWTGTGGYDGQGSILFDGTSGEVLISDTGNQVIPVSGAPFSFAFWFLPNAGLSGSTAMLSAGISGSTGFQFGIDSTTSPASLFLSISGSGGTTVETPLTSGTGWTQAAVTYDGTTASLYIDGTVQASGTGTLLSDTSTITIAQGFAGSNPFPGAMEGLTFYQALLQPTDIASLYDLSTTGTSPDPSGMANYWKYQYFGALAVDPNAYVPWSNGTVTNQQAFQYGLSPVDFYNGLLPNLTAITDTSLSGTFDSVSVLVTDTNNNPVSNAPVIFSTDYGLLVSPEGGSISQEVEVLSDSNGVATAMASPPWWDDVTYTFTAGVETAGLAPVTVVFSSQTAEDDPTMPPIPRPASPNPNQVNEPYLSASLTGTSIGNPAFEQFTDDPPIKWYLVSTETSSVILYQASEEGESFPIETGTGSYGMTGVVSPLFGGVAWNGNSLWMGTEYISGTGAVPEAWQSNTGVFPATDNPDDWSDTLQWSATPAGGGGSGTIGPEDEGSPTYGPGTPYVPGGEQWLGPIYPPTSYSQTATVEDTEYVYSDDLGDEDDYSNVITLSNEYTSQQFQSDVFNALESQTPSISSTEYGLGGTLAYRELADDFSSFTTGSAQYTFQCASTGSNPYVWEWYEIFQPDDDTQPITATHQEWDNANAAAQSPPFSLDPSTQSVDGVWYIARLDAQMTAIYPECQWRHVVGIGESVNLNLVGLPAAMSGSATWTYSSSAGVTGSFTSTHLTNNSNLFVVGRTPGDLTIMATFPSNTNCTGSTTFSVTLTVEAPTGVAYTKIASIPVTFPYLGCGMWGQYTFLPTNVSFLGLNFQEERCPAEDTYGFFQFDPIWHNPNGGSGVAPPPAINTDWTTGIQADNTADNLDRAESYLFIAPAIFTIFFPESGFTWSIPIRYRCLTDTDQGIELSLPVYSQMEIGSDQCTIIKGDAQVTQ
jgi:hypothetical protein